MRTFLRVFGVCALTVLLASPVLAQGGRGRGAGGGGGGLTTLLTNDSVQKELKLDADTITKVKDAVTKVTDAHKDDTMKLQGLMGEERRTKQAELTAAMNEETLKGVADILKPEQIKRLQQIAVQQASVQAFTKPEIQKALTLTDDQKDKIKTIAADMTKAMADLMPMRGAGGGGGGGAGRAANQEKITALRKETMDKVTGLLTDDQKKAWKELTGDDFTLVRPMGRRGNN